MTRKQQCLEALSILGQATATEVAQYMVTQGYAPIFQRNLSHPRLNELVEDGLVRICGETYDCLTDRMVSVYTLI